MAEPEDCTDLEGIPNIDLVALGTAPESMTNADQSYQERSLGDLIALDKYLRQKKVACNNPAAAGWGQIRIHRVIPPSSTGPG